MSGVNRNDITRENGDSSVLINTSKYSEWLLPGHEVDDLINDHINVSEDKENDNRDNTSSNIIGEHGISPDSDSNMMTASEGFSTPSASPSSVTSSKSPEHSVCSLNSDADVESCTPTEKKLDNNSKENNHKFDDPNIKDNSDENEKSENASECSHDEAKLSNVEIKNDCSCKR